MAENRDIPKALTEFGARALQWEAVVTHIGGYAQSALGRARVLGLVPSADPAWIGQQQQRTAELRLLEGAGGFALRGIPDPQEFLETARIEGAALEPQQLLDLIEHGERIAAWQRMIAAPPDAVKGKWTAIEALSAPLAPHDIEGMLRQLRGKLEPDGTVSDDASPELRRIRRALAAQHKAIEASLRRALTKITEEGATQDAVITVRGERFVIPIKAEFRRRVPGVIHGASSTGQTVFVEPIETIEQNNEMTRLLDEEQAEVHRILVAMTRAVRTHADGLQLGAEVLAEVDKHLAAARYARAFDAVRPVFTTDTLELQLARHPLLELRLRNDGGSVVPLTVALAEGKRQLIISGPNTGGKTVALKTTGILAAMAQAGLPVPAASAKLPLFTAIYADIGDAQSIEQNLSTFSAHVTNITRIAREANARSLILLDELGAATDPEEGAALAVAVAEHFLRTQAWSLITTHLTSLKIYAARHDGVLNAAVGFDEATLAPTYELRLGVPGASAGLNIAARLGLDQAIVSSARAQLTTQQADIGRFLDELHAQLDAAAEERAELAARQEALARERERLEREGRAEQQARTRELEKHLRTLLADFESQVRESVKAIGDKTVAQKIAKQSAVRVAQLKREFSEQFQSTVNAHTGGADAPKRPAHPHAPAAGDLVRLKTLGREGRITHVIDAHHFEVTVGSMKMRVPLRDIAEVVPTEKPAEAARRRGINLTTVEDGDSVSMEINVIGRTAEEAEGEVERFIERAFLAGLPTVRVVHGVGMGILRRTLRDYLRKHPHVATVSEPPQNEGGAGATLVALKV